jgi:hypothetical protein
MATNRHYLEKSSKINENKRMVGKSTEIRTGYPSNTHPPCCGCTEFLGALRITSTFRTPDVNCKMKTSDKYFTFTFEIFVT